MKYQTFTTGNKVIVVSHYAGKAVKGCAKCDPKDTFNFDNGQHLATLRCDEKIAIKRFKRAMNKLAEAQAAFNAAQKHLLDMQDYVNESREDLISIHADLKTFESEL
jgi:hypothetical protein